MVLSKKKNLYILGTCIELHNTVLFRQNYTIGPSSLPTEGP